MIRELAVAASIGVAVLIFTNLILLPIGLSYTGVSAKAAARSLRAEQADASGAARHPMWAFLDRFTQRPWATVAVLAARPVSPNGLVWFLDRNFMNISPWPGANASYGCRLH